MSTLELGVSPIQEAGLEGFHCIGSYMKCMCGAACKASINLWYMLHIHVYVVIDSIPHRPTGQCGSLLQIPVRSYVNFPLMHAANY